jgi:Protein of unknown function (DUF3079)
MARLPVRPKNPDRICWGCDKYCPADGLACGNGTIRTPHPLELFGEDWLEWSETHAGSQDEEADADAPLAQAAL